MSKSTHQRKSRTPVCARPIQTTGKALPLRRTWPISLCIGLAVGSIVFSGDALAGGPTGGVVVGGTGSITQSGNSTIINQASQKLALNWQTFNVGANESVLFNQPSRSAVALNRILDQNPSQIFGRINSNGQIFLINTHGIIFGATAQMNVGGLLASTLDLTPNDFLAGHYNLNASGAGAGIVNHGLIQAASGGSVALVGGSVLNDGLIFASYGKINLDGADHAVLDFDGNGLINIQITGELKQRLDQREAAVTNKGTLRAEDGTVVLQASAAKDLFTSLVNNTGIVDASGISTDGGVVRLIGNGGNVESSGSINVSGVHGGSAQLLADRNVGVTGSIDASGTLGGGSIRVGGGWQGGEGLQTAAVTYIGPDAALNADAIGSGDGGSVVVWGNQGNNFFGRISARGGAYGGNGGRVETSSHDGLNAQGSVDASAAHGLAGTWLLDPYDVTIGTPASGTAWGNPYTPTATSTIKASDINAALNSNTNVFVFTNTAGNGTDTGNITVNSAISAAGAGNLYLEAVGSILLNANISGKNASNPLGLYLWANYGGAAAGTTYSSQAACPTCVVTIGNAANAAITTFGGAVDIRTGDATHAGGAVNIGNGAFTGSIDTSGTAPARGALTVDAASITQLTAAGNDITAGAATLKAGSGAIALTNTANSFTGAVSLTGGNVSLVNGTATALGTTTATGTLDVSSNGALSQSGALTVTGAASFTQNSTTAGASQDINLGNQNNSLQGGVTFAAGAGAGINNLSLKNTYATPGTLTLPASVAGILTLNYTNAAATLAVPLAGTTLGGLDLTAGGGITINGDVSTGGAQAYHSAVTLGADAILASTGGGNIGFDATVNGAHGLTVNTGGVTSFGGVVGGTTALTSLGTDVGGSSTLGGNVTTSGTQTYNDAVTLGSNVTLATTNSNVSFGSTVDNASTTARSLTVNAGSGAVTFSGAVGGDLTNGALGALAVNSTGATHLNAAVKAASLATDAGGSTVLLDGNVTTSGTQTYADAVTLGSNAALTGTTVSLAGVTGAGNNLTLTGNAALNGAVSGVSALQVSGTTALNTASVSTTGGQTYTGTLTLGIDATVASSGSGAIGFGSTVDGAYALTVNTGGVTSFGGAVGAVNKLTSLTTDTAGSTTLGGNVTTSGAQSYSDAVTLGGDVTLATTNSNVSFSGTVDNANATARNLSVNAGSGAVTFGGAVGGGANGALTSLGTNSGTFSAGALSIGSGGLSVVTTAGGITQANPFTVTGASSFNAGANAITLTNAGNAFTGPMSLAGGSVSLVNNQATQLGATTAGSLDVGSNGALSQSGALTVTGAATFTQNSITAGATQDINLGNQNNSLQGGVTFAAGVGAGINNLSLKNTYATPGTLVLPASVAGSLTLNYTNAALVLPMAGIGGALDATAGGGITINGDVSTGGAQAYHSAVTLGADAILASTGGGNIGFDATVNGAHGLTVNTGGVTSFGGVVGGTTALTSLGTDVGGSSTLGGNVTTSGTQTYNDAVTLGSNVTLATTNSNVSFGSTVDNASTTARSLTVNAGSGAVTFSGAVGGDLTNGALAGLSTSSGTFNANVLNIGSGGLSVTTSTGGIGQGGAFAVAGTSSFNAGANAITLSDAGNDFTGAVSLNNSGANNVAIRDANGLILGNVSVGTGTLGVQAVGITQAAGTAIVQSGAAGAASFNSGGGVLTLANTGNDFSGAVNLSGGATQITDQNALTLGTLSTGALTVVSTGALNLGAGSIGGNLSASSNNGAISQTGALAVSGSSTLNAGANAITLSDAGNDFAGAVSLSNSGANNVAISDANALVLGASAVGSGTLTLTATGISQTGGIVQSASGGVVMLDAGAGDLDLTNASNDFTGQVTANGQAVRIADATALDMVGFTSALNKDVSLVAAGQLTLAPTITTIDTGSANLTLSSGASLTTPGSLSGNNVSLTGASGLTLNNNLTATGALTLASSTGGIAQTGGSILAGSTSTVSGGSGAASLTSAGNDFVGTVTASGSSISLTDMNALTAALTTGGNAVLTAGGSLAVSGSSSNLTTNAAATSFGVMAVGGNLSTTATGAISQTGALSVTGNSSFAAGANAITLSDAGNDFTGAVSLNNSGANNVAIRDANGLILGNVSVGTGTLDVQAVGITQAAGTAIVQSAAAGAASFNSGGGVLTLANTGNDFSGAVNLSGGATQVTDQNALTLGTLSTGALTVVSTGALNLGVGSIGGNLSASSNNGTIGQTGALAVSGSSTLNAGSGTITLSNANNDFVGAVNLSGGATQIIDKNALTLGTLSTGALTVVSTGALNLGAGSIGGNLSASSNNGTIGQTGALAVSGSSTLNAGSGTITLSNANNDFVGAVNLSGGATQITDQNALTLGTLSTGALTAVSTGALNLGAGSIGGNLSASSNNGAIGQTGALAVSGSSTLNAGSGTITLSNANNDFVGAVNLSGGATQITDQNALTLGTLSTGALTAVSTGALNLGAGSIGGNLSASSNNGAIGQTGALAVSGSNTLNAGSGTITLSNASNDFVGAVTATGTGMQISDANDLSIAALTNGTNGSISLVAGGTLALPTGAIDTGTSNLVLTSNGGALSTSGDLSGQNVTLTGHGGLTLNSNVTAADTLSLSSGAGISQGAGIITAATLTGSSVGNTVLGQGNLIGTLGSFSAANFSLNNAQALSVSGPVTTTGDSGDISLATSSGELVVNTGLAGNAVALDSAGNLALANDVSANTVTLTSGGNISQGGGVITAGTLSGSAAGGATLGQANKIAALGAFSANGFSLVNGQALAVSGSLSGGTSTSLTTTTGDLAINGAVSGTATTLKSAGAINEGAGGSLTAGTLSGQSAGATTLNGANHIGTLGSFNATGFALTNAQTLAVGGPVNGGANASLTTTAGDLAINGAVNGTAIVLKSAGAISQGAGGSLTAGVLSGQSAGATTLNGTNHIGTLGNFSAASFALTNAQALAVSGPVSGGASTSLTTSAGDLAINGAVSGTTTTLHSAAAITEGAGGSITADLLTGSSVGNATLDGSNHINKLGSFTSDFSLTNAQTLTVVGPLDGGPSVTLTTTAGDLVINGSITGATTTLRAAGTISQGAAGSITAGTLTGQSGGATTLGGANRIGTLGSFTAAGFGLTNAQALTVGGPISGGSSTTLTTTAGDLAINGAVSGTQTTLNSAGAISEGSGGVITASTLSGSAAAGTMLGNAAHRINNMVSTLGNFSSPAGFSMTNNQTLTLASVAGSAFTVNAGTSAFYLSVTNGDLFQLGTTPVYNGMGVWGSTGRMGMATAPIYVIGTGLQSITNIGVPPAYFYAVDSAGNLLPLGGGLAVNVPTASGAGSAQNGNHGDSYIDPGVITANYRSYGIVPSGVRLPADQQGSCDPDQPDQPGCEEGGTVGMVGVLMNVRR